MAIRASRKVLVVRRRRVIVDVVMGLDMVCAFSAWPGWLQARGPGWYMCHGVLWSGRTDPRAVRPVERSITRDCALVARS